MFDIRHRPEDLITLGMTLQVSRCDRTVLLYIDYTLLLIWNFQRVHVVIDHCWCLQRATTATDNCYSLSTPLHCLCLVADDLLNFLHLPLQTLIELFFAPLLSFAQRRSLRRIMVIAMRGQRYVSVIGCRFTAISHAVGRLVARQCDVVLFNLPRCGSSKAQSTVTISGSRS